MPRQPLQIGTYGNINTKQQKNGSWRASTRYRDTDGETRTVQAFGATKAQSENALKDKLKQRDGNRGEAITRDTKLSTLADLWLAELAFEGDVSQQTIDQYRDEIDVSTDRRARKSTIKIKSHLGSIRVHEATTNRIDPYLKSVAEVGREKARQHRIILSGMLGLAVRRGAISTNPVRDVSRIRKKRAKPRAGDIEQLRALRAQLRVWAAGGAIPGTDAYTSGPKRDRSILDISDVALGTGTRPGEVLAIRWCDLDLAATVPTLTICGTIVRNSERGLHRQEWTKTDAGYRQVKLPKFAADVLLKLKVDAVPNELDLVFPARNGGVRDPHNFRRTWRQARGSTFAWVTPKTFRKVVATAIADEHGPEAVASQLGHADGGDIARQHYIDKPAEVADFRATLDRFAE